MNSEKGNLIPSGFIDKDTKIVFFSAIKVPYGGGRSLFLDYGAYLADHYGYDTYYVTYQCGVMEESYNNSSLHLSDLDATDYSKFAGAVFFTAVNHLFFLLEKIKDVPDAKICLYFGHPQIFNWFSAQLHYTQATDENKSKILGLFWEKNAACFQDASNLLAANRLSEYKFEPSYVPTVLHEQLSMAPIEESTEKKFRLLWMGRLDSDKVYSITNCLDNIMESNLDMEIDFHIIGDGNSRSRINISKYAPKVRFIFTSYLYGEERDEYIRKNADLVMSMGICAQDCAMLGVPTIVPIVSPTEFIANKYVYIFDVPDYSLGWNLEDLEELGCETHTIKEVIDAVYHNPERSRELARKGEEFCRRTFSLERGGELLMHALSKTTLTVKDCMKCAPIKRQMKQYELFGKVIKTGGFDRYLAFMGRLNGNSHRRGLAKAGYLLSEARKSVAKRLNDRKSARQETALYLENFNSYEKKIENIKAIAQRDGVIKTAFPVLFNGVFPFRAVFEKMLHDDHFDPWIVVIPNVTRTIEYRKQKYFDALTDLTTQYGDRVLDGYNWDTGEYMEFGEKYQVVFFNNPYKNLVHPYHHAEYFLGKNVLTLYANYGFAALNFWDEVISMPFYNYMWRTCVETDSNLEYLRQHGALQGRNGFVTGYLKMDSMAEYKPTPKERKKILICPHHTVWGWSTLDISNFLSYAEYFVSLPDKFPEVDFIFRPHPLLFDNLIQHNIWSQEDIDAYLNRMLSKSNIVYDKSGDYFQTFVDSDAMIHDCGSFIGEYLFTEKPCCYMLKSLEQTKKTLLPLGQDCMEQYYHAFSSEDIDKFIRDVVLGGDDPMKEQRETFSREVLKKYYPHCADRIIDEIRNTVF